MAAPGCDHRRDDEEHGGEGCGQREGDDDHPVERKQQHGAGDNRQREPDPEPAVTAPSGDQPIWAFAEAKPRTTSVVAIARSKARPSRLTLPVVPHFDIPTELPPCPGLRGEPCRDFVPFANRNVKR